MAQYPKINYKKCKNVKACIQVCPAGVFAEEKGKIIVKYPEKCIQCGACVASCPNEAIELVVKV